MPEPLSSLSLAGSVLVGALFSVGLYGILCVQAYSYNLRATKSGVKLLSNVLFLLSTSKMIIEAQDAYEVLANNNKQRRHYWAILLLTCTVLAIVQCYYAVYVASISKKRYLGALVVIISIVSYSGGLITTAMAQMKTHPKKTYYTKVASIGLWHGGSLICDLIIASSITYFSLRDYAARPSKALALRVIRRVVGGGILITFITFSCAILWFVNHTNNFCNIYIGYIAHLYVISMFVLLNNQEDQADVYPAVGVDSRSKKASSFSEVSV